ncbi:sodium/calcium antiporter [Haloferula helveola]|uniref:Sodium/calcium antiporter n=1 Tax=Haloferula helveola TaxID=490095 RepID=A0ABN6H6C9_9BACT|nr:sodium/calcium antiporter [Haloferula helveola]
MWLHALLVAVSFLILFAGAEMLVRGGSALAIRLGLTPLVVGLTVVAYGTSTPELLVSLKSAFAGQPDIAVGNVVGSNLFNIAVILGISAVILPIRSHLQILRWDAPVLLAVTLLAPLTFLDGVVTRTEGGVLLILAAAYTIWAIRLARREGSNVEVSDDDAATVAKPGLAVAAVLIAAGLGVLVFGSRLLVTHAVEIAQSLGVSEAVIGLTIVAAGTSMPELATSVVAAFRGQSDIALGNVLGSNLFNLLFVLGGSALVHPVSTSGITLLDLGAMALVTGLLVPFLITGKRLGRLEGTILLATFAAYLFLMWPRG